MFDEDKDSSLPQRPNDEAELRQRLFPDISAPEVMASLRIRGSIASGGDRCRQLIYFLNAPRKSPEKSEAIRAVNARTVSVLETETRQDPLPIMGRVGEVFTASANQAVASSDERIQAVSHAVDLLSQLPEETPFLFSELIPGKVTTPASPQAREAAVYLMTGMLDYASNSSGEFTQPMYGMGLEDLKDSSSDQNEFATRATPAIIAAYVQAVRFANEYPFPEIAKQAIALPPAKDKKP
jgi:hypothetical protein